ncbi:MAG TPA: hypothetical protein VFU47_06145, partial [Armatimonadota bacterium]|nr:hypothetical protein [Armatimonadota bacterium]
ARLFRPVNNTPVGDDSDDGNGWRATTRLGANDRTCLFVAEQRLEHTRAGMLPRHVVRELYRDTVRIPGYLRLDDPGAGYSAAVQAEGRLRGLTLIPCPEGKDWAGGGYQMRYCDELGLLVEKA